MLFKKEGNGLNPKNAYNSSFYFSVIEVKTTLGALSKNFVGIELDWHITLGTSTLVRVKSARVIAIWIGDPYMG